MEIPHSAERSARETLSPGLVQLASRLDLIGRSLPPHERPTFIARLELKLFDAAQALAQQMLVEGELGTATNEFRTELQEFLGEDWP